MQGLKFMFICNTSYCCKIKTVEFYLMKEHIRLRHLSKTGNKLLVLVLGDAS